MKWTDNQTTCTLLSDLQCISSLWDEGWCLCLMPLDCLPCTSLWQTDQRTLTAVLRVDGKVHQLLSGGDTGGEGGKGVLLLWRLLRKRAQTQLRHLQHPFLCTLGLRYKQTQHNTTQHNTTQQTQTQHEHLQHFCPSTLGSQWTEEMSVHINPTRHIWTHSKVKGGGFISVDPEWPICFPYLGGVAKLLKGLTMTRPAPSTLIFEMLLQMNLILATRPFPAKG